MQNIKDPILETLQDTISILRTDLVHKQKTIDTLMLIIEKATTGPSNVQAWLTGSVLQFLQSVLEKCYNLINFL